MAGQEINKTVYSTEEGNLSAGTVKVGERAFTGSSSDVRELTEVAPLALSEVIMSSGEITITAINKDMSMEVDNIITRKDGKIRTEDTKAVGPKIKTIHNLNGGEGGSGMPIPMPLSTIFKGIRESNSLIPQNSMLQNPFVDRSNKSIEEISTAAKKMTQQSVKLLEKIRSLEEYVQMNSRKKFNKTFCQEFTEIVDEVNATNKNAEKLKNLIADHIKVNHQTPTIPKTNRVKENRKGKVYGTITTMNPQSANEALGKERQGKRRKWEERGTEEEESEGRQHEAQGDMMESDVSGPIERKKRETTTMNTGKSYASILKKGAKEKEEERIKIQRGKYRSLESSSEDSEEESDISLNNIAREITKALMPLFAKKKKRKKEKEGEIRDRQMPRIADVRKDNAPATDTVTDSEGYKKVLNRRHRNMEKTKIKEGPPTKIKTPKPKWTIPND